jgi:hypothetical protein
VVGLNGVKLVLGSDLLSGTNEVLDLDFLAWWALERQVLLQYFCTLLRFGV